MGNWDFRDSQEISLASSYLNTGYVIFKAKKDRIDLMKRIVESEVSEFTGLANVPLENIHTVIRIDASNQLRMKVLNKIWESDKFNRLYFEACREIVEILCGNELAMQKRIGMSVQLPGNFRDSLPIHADTWNGVSEYELNLLVPLIDCKNTMSLFILDRQSYDDAQNEFPGLLKESSEEAFNQLESRLTWIEIDYGSVLAFDQSLPHGFCINREKHTHWSLNCRFKSLFSPYRDKKLGEYFMPITTKACTFVGANYREPLRWLQ